MVTAIGLLKANRLNALTNRNGLLGLDCNMMQSQTADCAPVPPPAKLDKTYRRFFILAYFLHCMKRDVADNTGST